MDYTGLIAAGVVVAVLYGWYATIITRKNKAKEALSDIDAQLKKRSDLLPNILKIAKKFMDHEKELITKVTELRTKVDKQYNANDTQSVKEHLQAVGALDQQLGKFMLAVEAYPTLKSDQTMLQAMVTYNEVEEHIAAARRFYNAAAGSLNNSVEIFPGSILAGLARVGVMPFYEVDEESKAPVDAGAYLN